MAARPYLTPDQLATWRAFLTAHARVLAALDRQLAASGVKLDLREYDLLVHLAEAGAQGLRLRDLAGRLLINRSNVTRRIEELDRRGLVARRPDPADRRGVIATLTPTGRRALARAARVHLPGVRALVFGGEPVDLEEVRRFLQQIAAACGEPPSPHSAYRERPQATRSST
jgi:DNA-binding MarR family transcriptional regulator